MDVAFSGPFPNGCNGIFIKAQEDDLLKYQWIGFMDIGFPQEKEAI